HAADIVFDHAGNAYVSDYLHFSVKKFSSQGVLLRTYQFDSGTFGLHLVSDDKLLVVLTAYGPSRNTVAELDLTSGAITTFATNLSEPFGMTVGPDGRYYFANYHFATGYGGFDPDSIYVVDPDGGVAERWNTSQGDLNGAVFPIFADGDLFVNSYYNNRVV